MLSKMKFKNGFIKYLPSILYVLIIHYCYLALFKYTFAGNARGNLFIYDFNLVKYIVCIFECIIVIFVANMLVSINGLTEKTIFILDYLYFIPGFVQAACLNYTWGYIVYYFLFWLFVHLFLNLIKPREAPRITFTFRNFNIETMISILTVIAVVTAFIIVLYLGTDVSITNIIYTFNDIYEVRRESKLANIHWIVLNIKNWASYIIVFMIAYYSEKRKWWVVVILEIAELSVFLIQANRILVFLAILAIPIGLFNSNNKRLMSGFLIFAALILIETSTVKTGFTATDIFRRYTVVPNRLSEQYFDYFLTNEPDYLRLVYNRLLRPFGIVSPYEDPPIGYTIGYKYFGYYTNSNNGLVGGAAFQFGLFGCFICPFGLIFGLRMFENATRGLEKSRMITIISLLLATISINNPGFLTNIFSLSYLMPLYLCLIPFSKRENNNLELDFGVIK